jgi:hypothetical protein
MKDTVFFERTYRLHHQGERMIIFLRSVLRLLVNANVVPSSPICVTLMMEAIRSSETSVLTRTTQCHRRRRHSSRYEKVGTGVHWN